MSVKGTVIRTPFKGVLWQYFFMRIIKIKKVLKNKAKNLKISTKPNLINFNILVIIYNN